MSFTLYFIFILAVTYIMCTYTYYFVRKNTVHTDISLRKRHEGQVGSRRDLKQTSQTSDRNSLTILLAVHISSSHAVNKRLITIAVRVLAYVYR